MNAFPPRGRPRRVEGGIRARSTRGSIGASWWSRRFVEVLESLDVGTRLTSGRSYARRGQVLSLQVSPGRVTARVQGSAPKPYNVAIGLSPFPPAVWSKVESYLTGQALYSAQLLAGEMPPEIEQVFTACDAPLFPSSVGELDFSCTCPDHVRPCKHIAATLYLLAEAFDADPFQILHWRGREREALLAHLRTRPAVRKGPDSDEQGALPDSADLFWVPPVPLPARPATLATEPDLLLRQLPPPGPALGGAELVEHLRAAYWRFAGLS